MRPEAERALKRLNNQQQERKAKADSLYERAVNRFGMKKTAEILGASPETGKGGVSHLNTIGFEMLREALGEPESGKPALPPQPINADGVSEHIEKMKRGEPNGPFAMSNPKPAAEPKVESCPMPRQQMRAVAACFPEFDAPNDCTDRQYFEKLSAVAYRNFIRLPGMESDEALSKKHKRDPDPSGIANLVRAMRRNRIAQILEA
jgi:hypothetical protein